MAYLLHTSKISINAPIIKFQISPVVTFQYQLKGYQDVYLVILAQIHYTLLYGQTIFPRILSQNSQITLKDKVNEPHFQYQPRVSQDACLVQIWLFQAKSVRSYQECKPNFLEFQVKMAKMTLKVKISDPHIQYQLWIFNDACLVQIWWFQLKAVTGSLADNIKFTDRQTDTIMKSFSCCYIPWQVISVYSNRLSSIQVLF